MGVSGVKGGKIMAFVVLLWFVVRGGVLDTSLVSFDGVLMGLNGG